MTNLHKLFLALVPLAAIPSAASAAPADFNGTYNLTCQSGSYRLHFDLWGSLNDQSVSYHPADLVVPVPCEGDDPAIAGILADVEQACLAANLGNMCDDIVDAVASAIENTSALVPTRVTTAVTNADNWFAKLTKIFMMDVGHEFDDGTIRNGTYLISDRNDSSNGDFLSLSLAVNGASSNGIAGCVATTLGAVNGTIARNAGFALTAGLDLDKSLSCGFAYNGDWLAGVIGLTFHAGISGVRVQP
jgi:hypothetical protein